MLKVNTTAFEESFEEDAKLFHRKIDVYEGSDPLSEVDKRVLAIIDRIMAGHVHQALFALRDNRVDEAHYDYLQGIADRVRISDTSLSLTKGLLAAAVLYVRGVNPELAFECDLSFKALFEPVDVIAKRGIRSDNAPKMLAVLSMYELEDKNTARSFCAKKLKDGFRQEFAAMTIDKKGKFIRKQAEDTQYLITLPTEFCNAEGNTYPAAQLEMSSFIFNELEQGIRKPEGRESRQFLQEVMKNHSDETPFLAVNAARILAGLPEMRREALDVLNSYINSTDGPIMVLANEAKNRALRAPTKAREDQGRHLS